MRFALAQINPTVGDIQKNADRIRTFAFQAAHGGAQIVVFPELALCGYPPEDLLLKPHFVEECLHALDALSSELPPQVVCVIGTPTWGKEKARNSAAVFHSGRRVAYYHKRHLPNYGVFDEQRVFEPGDASLCLQCGPVRIGVHICEDSWIPGSPSVISLKAADAKAVINLSASPFHRLKQSERVRCLQQTAEALGAPLLYCNLCGGQDELVFDGASMVLLPGAGLVARAKEFDEDILMYDLAELPESPLIDEMPAPASVDWVCLSVRDIPDEPSPEPPRLETVSDDLASVHGALVTGLRDYVNKNGFRDVFVAISGGIDSALVASLAVDALGADRVSGCTLPTRYSSEGTLSDAQALASNLRIPLHTIPIQPLFDHYLTTLSPFWPGRQPDTTEENLQARIRGAIVMAFSNKFGSLVLATGNKSELATGYCTLYGDMCGGFAVIKDVPKTLVFALSRWRNERQYAPWIPETTITRPPSAELRENQTDQDSLPPYDLLDRIIEEYVERDCSMATMIAMGLPEETVNRVIRLIDGNEYKRRQAAPGIKITPKAFGRDRRIPITNRFREKPPIPHP